MLTGVLVQSFIEFSDEFLEDVSHLLIRDIIRVQVNVLKPFHHLE